MGPFKRMVPIIFGTPFTACDGIYIASVAGLVVFTINSVAIAIPSELGNVWLPISATNATVGATYAGALIYACYLT